MTRLAIDKTGRHVQAIRPIVVQVVAYTGTAGVTTNPVADTTIVRIIATSACFYKVGTAPTATTSDNYLPADTIEFVSVNANSDKVSFVQLSAGGNAYVSEGA